MNALKGKVAVVTGGTSGIGLATVKRFTSEGAHVFVAGRKQDELNKVATEFGSNVTTIQTDISKIEDLDRFYAKIAATGKKIDVVFAGVGFVEKALTTEVTPEHFDKTFDTNVRGTFFTVQKALPLMNDGGSIIVIGAAGKEKGFPTRSTYSATKAALRSLVRTWTSELKERKIRSNLLSPGAVQTPLLDSVFPSKDAAAQSKKSIETITPLGRIGRPEEIAAAALFLASDESSFITGIDLVVDGGMTAV